MERMENMKLPWHLLPLSLLCLQLVLPQTSMAVYLLSDSQVEPKGKDHLDLGRSRDKIFHPPNGLCVLRKLMFDPLKLGDCAKSDAWYYTPRRYLMIKGTYFCLQAVGQGEPVKLGVRCMPSNSRWEVISGSRKTQLATMLADGSTVCLDVDSNGTVISNPCKDIRNEEDAEGFDGQWFKIVSVPRSSIRVE